jgi:hypothetical protein
MPNFVRNETQPLEIFENRVNVTFILRFGIGVVETKDAYSIVFVGDPEIQTNCLGVTNVQVAVGLWGKSRLYPAAKAVGLGVGFDQGPNEIGSRR